MIANRLGWSLREANLAPCDALIFDPGGGFPKRHFRVLGARVDEWRLSG